MLLELIGKGAHSEVHRGMAVLNEQEAEVAVKIVSKASLSVRLVEDEIALLRRISHPNVVRFINKYETRNNHYIVTELCAQGNFREFLRRHYSGGAIPEAHIREFMRQICRGLGEIHAQGIAHRDLKHENVFIDADCVLKIGDFGFAKLVGEAELLSSFKGTPVNMAPEIFHAHRRKGAFYDKKCDVWSLGTMLYELVYGQLFGDFKSVADLQSFSSSEQEVQLPPGKSVSPACAELLLGMLRKDPRQRLNVSEIANHAFLVDSGEPGSLLTALVSSQNHALRGLSSAEDVSHLSAIVAEQLQDKLRAQISSLATRLSDHLCSLGELQQAMQTLPCVPELASLLALRARSLAEKFSAVNLLVTDSAASISAFVTQIVAEQRQKAQLDALCGKLSRAVSEVVAVPAGEVLAQTHLLCFAMLEESLRSEAETGEAMSEEEAETVREVYAFGAKLLEALAFDFAGLFFTLRFHCAFPSGHDPTQLSLYFRQCPPVEEDLSPARARHLRSLCAVEVHLETAPFPDAKGAQSLSALAALFRRKAASNPKPCLNE